MAAEEDKGAVPEGLAAAPPAFKKRVAAGKNFRRRGKGGGWHRWRRCCTFSSSVHNNGRAPVTGK